MKNLNMTIKVPALLVLFLPLASCSSGQNDLTDGGRIQNLHVPMVVTDPNASSFSAKDTVSAQAVVNIGSVYLESQMAPATVTGTQLQASDIAVNGGDAYVSYSSIDVNNQVIKKGALEHVRPYLCDNPLTLTLIEYCLQSVTTFQIPTSDIFASFSDGSNLYAVGSTSDESDLTSFGRLYKINFDASKNPISIAATANLPSYAGTGVIVKSGLVFATSGASPSSSMMGGLSVFNSSTLSKIGSTVPLYDARDVAANSIDSNKVWLTLGNSDGSHPSSLIPYTFSSDGTTLTAGTSVTVAGNTIAESKSTLAIGKTLVLASTGSGGFKVICKANGATLSTTAAITVSGIDPTKTVTNSVASVPGYIFAADGEAGIYVYQFTKKAGLGTYCSDGVNVTQLGRLSLAASSTYVNAELSANSVYALTFLDVVNAVTNRMIVVASGNKGTSLINVTNIALLGASAVDDF